MSRVEENRKFIEFIENEAGEKKVASYDEGVMFQLGAINCILSDISKSLAVIADAKEATTEVLDKIRAEIVQIPTISFNANDIYKADVLAIIDKYRESEDI